MSLATQDRRRVLLTGTALYLSDVLATSYNAVKDTAVYPGDQVAVFGAGPIGQMAGVFALGEGAKVGLYAWRPGQGAPMRSPADLALQAYYSPLLLVSG